MKHILVTGSSGTVGTAVCTALLDHGHQLTGIDIKPNPYSRDVQEHTVMADLRDRERVLKLAEIGYDAIIHLGANARVPHSVKDPTLACDNIDATFNMLELSRRKPGCPFIFASSKDVYGNSDSTVEDSLDIECCESPYAASKIASEAMIFAYHKCYGINFSVLRISNVYGRYSEPDRVIPIFIRLTRNSQDITVNGADKVLDFIHTDDVSRAFLLVLSKFNKAANQVFNLGSGQGTSLLQLAQLIVERLEGSNRVIVRESARGDVVHSISEISRIRETLGFEPTIDIRNGLRTEVEE